MKLFFACRLEKEENQNNMEDDYNFDHYLDNKIKDEDNLRIKNKDSLSLKIYIIGSGDEKEYIINNLFRDKIDDSMKDLADKEFKTEQFHWIARIYKEEFIDEKICEELRKEIKKDKSNKENKILKYQVILCFGNKNTKIISSHFTKLRQSRMIFVTDSECDLDEKMDKRYVTNIICKNISNEQLNSKIITALWEIDCCFKEKGNQMCRYTPEKIFNGFENDNSLFSINILLTGLSRTGKSTFINLLSGKIIALEADSSDSVTKNISEYYIYKCDNKDGHAAIKIIDTPGIVPNDNKKEYREVQNKVIDMIKNQDKDFNTKIHFIFFILNKDSSLEGENILEILETLNQSKCPVYFILNKTEEDDNFDSLVDPKTEYFDENKFENLSKEDNFILANFKAKGKKKIFGIDKIFQKIKDHIENKNYLNKELGDKMKNLLKDYRSQVAYDKSFFDDDKDKNWIEKKKSVIDFDKRMKEINELISKNDFFSKIGYNILIDNGKKIADKCCDVIISLSKLKQLFPTSSGNVPSISIFQAFMIKEIGEGFGQDINALNSQTKLLMNKLNILKENEGMENNNDNEKLSEILDNKEITEYREVIKEKIQDKLQKGNEKGILPLAKLMNQIREKYIQWPKENNKLGEEELINFDLTVNIYKFCLCFFERELKESDCLSFMVNYFDRIESLLKDIEDYINKNDWEKYNLEIKK